MTIDLPNSTLIIYRDESYLIQGAIFEVYKEIGLGYQECLKREFTLRNIPFSSQQDFEIQYNGDILPVFYRPDFICFNRIIIKLKAVKEITDEHRAQLHNYLRISGFKLGLLVNFAHYPKAAINRIVL